MLRGPFCAPDDTGGSTRGVKTGVGTVAFVGSSKLPMGLGMEL